MVAVHSHVSEVNPVSYSDPLGLASCAVLDWTGSFRCGKILPGSEICCCLLCLSCQETLKIAQLHSSEEFVTLNYVIMMWLSVNTIIDVFKAIR